MTVAMFLPWSASIWLVNITKDRTEATHCCSCTSLRTRNEEQSLSDVAADRSKQSQRTERRELSSITRVAEKRDETTLRSA